MEFIAKVLADEITHVTKLPAKNKYGVIANDIFYELTSH